MSHSRDAGLAPDTLEVDEHGFMVAMENLAESEAPDDVLAVLSVLRHAVPTCDLLNTDWRTALRSRSKAFTGDAAVMCQEV